MPHSKQPSHFQSLMLLQWPLSYLAIFWILQPLFIYLLFTSLWPLPALYFAWLFLDWKTPERGGRRSAWVRNWCVWTHIKDYFPITILKTKDLSPEHNYLMGVHPHGLLTFGAFCNFCTEATGFSKTFPGITPHLATLSWFFKIPFLREYLMAKGVCSVSQPAIDYLLSHGTGNLVGIVVGGVGEALQSVPNTTTLILQKRKGFVRTALQHGAHLVPTFTFGETEVYDQVLFHKDSRMYKFQSCFRHIFGFYCCVFYGQSFCQGSTGLLPYSRPIVTVVGEPLPLPQIEKPSQEMVDKYHALYMDALHKLFDQHKTHYGCSETQKLFFL
ncbi:acyl-CoA wax alcohol acyltransferase 1 [Pongo pygmaeus]|uniref:Acyltransferase n=1 Tax=Pongo abelii TaxID=9601 RepID=H2PVX4_PONAB|nr:acyl-CoA wax alcohol acyltransferase 1 [Pongo abelii]XP_054326719.1 acyl-CoA wax alcohol acyltransferase 1 [Pongo pygmaeus]PNJ42590.1 AWAT1 isoform 1 [Pongo abelii]